MDPVRRSSRQTRSPTRHEPAALRIRTSRPVRPATAVRRRELHEIAKKERRAANEPEVQRKRRPRQKRNQVPC